MKYRKLGDFVSLKQGLAINKATNHYISEEKNSEFCYPLLRIVDMIENNFSKYVSKNININFICNKNDIIYTRTGQIGLAFRGYEGVVHNNSFIVNIENDDLDRDYLYVILNSEFVKKQALSLAKNSVQPDLTHDMFKSILIPFPDKKNQKKIAKIILCLENKIKINNSISLKLEELAIDFYNFWFLQFDFPNDNGRPYRSSGGKMIWNTELQREIPVDWNITTVGNITICHDSKRVPLSDKERKDRKGVIPYYGATGIMDYVNDFIFDGDYILMAEDGSVMNNSGNPIIQRITGKTWVNNHAHVLQPVGGYTCKLLTMMLKDISVMKIKTGSIQMKINQENMNRIVLPKIPDKIMKEINYKLEIIDKQQLQLKLENEKISKLYNFLLPLLISGQVGFKSWINNL